MYGEWGRNPAELSMDRREKWKPGEEHERAYAKAEEVLSKNAMDRSTFADLYTPEAIARDDQYVAGMLEKFAQNEAAEPEQRLMKEKATILQAIVHENGAKWLGDDRAKFYRTDPYDDIHAGIDEIISFPRDTSRSELGLSIDVTFATSIDDKVQGIVNSIRNGRLPKAKYVAGTGFRGELVIPKVVLGVHAGKVDNMQRLWLRPKADLGQHAFRHFMMDELLFQTEAFLKLAKSKGQSVAADRYAHAYEYLMARQKAMGKPIPEVKEEIDSDVMVKRLKESVRSAIG